MEAGVGWQKSGMMLLEVRRPLGPDQSYVGTGTPQVCRIMACLRRVW